MVNLHPDKSPRWKSSDIIERALLLDWETRVSHDLHDGPSVEPITYSVERGTGEDRQVLAEGLSAGEANAIESMIYALDSMLAHTRREMPA